MVDNYQQKYLNQVLELGKLLNNNFTKLFNPNNLNKLEKIYVYIDQDIIKGFIHISSNFEIIDILNIAVNPKYQNQQIGTTLINYVINNKKTEENKIMLEVREDNINAIKFYQKNNFITINKRKKYYKDIDALIMERNL